MIIERFDQGSPEWIQARVGVVTMSNAKALLTGGKGVTRQNYLNDVVAERITGRPTESISTWDMERGILLEPFALRAYQEHRGFVEIETIGLAYLDEQKTISASPDGLTAMMAEGAGGVEIKCPRPRNHMKYIGGPSAFIAYQAQIQGNMWIFDVEHWDFVSFCPEFEALPLYVHRVYRDEDMIIRIEQASHLAVETIDAMEATLRRNTVPNWLAEICGEATAAVESFLNDGEVEL